MARQSRRMQGDSEFAFRSGKRFSNRTFASCYVFLLSGSCLLFACCAPLIRALSPTSSSNEFFFDWADQGFPRLEQSSDFFSGLSAYRFKSSSGKNLRHFHDDQQRHESRRLLGSLATAIDALALTAEAVTRGSLAAAFPVSGGGFSFEWHLRHSLQLDLRRFRHARS